MYDYVKIVGYSLDLKDKLLNNTNLQFDTLYNKSTGEIIHEEALFRKLKITTYPEDRVKVSGSLHKYWDLENRNHSDFTLANVAEAIADLEHTLGIDPDIMRVENLEFGVNIHLQYSPNVFLDSLIVFKSHPFDTMDVIGVGYGKVAKMAQYSLKIYNKSLQYGLSDNILRFERKVTKMEYIRKLPIYLSDLLDPLLASTCLKNLLDSFDNLIVFEPVNEAFLPKRKLQFYKDLSNPRFWKQMTAKQRWSKKPLFESIIEELGTLRLKANLYSQINIKGQNLIDCLI